MMLKIELEARPAWPRPVVSARLFYNILSGLDFHKHSLNQL